MKKKLTIAAVVVVVFSLLAYGTMAYLTAQGTAHNIITSGSIQIELLDKTAPDSFDETDPGFNGNFASWQNFTDKYPGENGGMAVMPGTQASKWVGVLKSEESSECWVRIRLHQVMRLADGTPAMTHLDQVVSLNLNLDRNLDMIPDADKWTAELDDNGVPTGWYYYNSPLTDENPLTAPLFTTVTFSGPGMGNEYQGATYELTVEAQAVQSDNNPIPDGGNVTDVAGWPDSSIVIPGGDTEEPDTEEPDTEEPGTEEPDTEEPGTDEPDTENPDDGEPVVPEEPVTGGGGAAAPDDTPSAE